jgi:phage portal protein BeeE
VAFWNRKPKQEVEQRFGFDQLIDMMSFNGTSYPFLSGGTLTQGRETIDPSFRGFVDGIYKRNGVVFACIAAKMRVFSEARFQYQQLRGGRPGDLFGTPDLDILETPWPNATTGDLLSRMLLHADIAGNAFVRRMPPSRPGAKPRLMCLRPDWVTIVGGSDGDPNEGEVLGYIYQPGGPGSGVDPVTLFPEQVAHFAPNADPIAHFRGMSWLTTVLTDVMADGASSTHKLKFFEQGATPNLVVTLGDTQLKPADFQQWVEKMDATHSGSQNAYKTLYLAAGADAKVVGSDLKQIDFEAVQGAGETRIAAAAGIPPVLVGLSEGLDAATYSNYALAKRSFADGTIRPMWHNAAGSLSSIIASQSGARLWYDDRHIPFLQEDRKDAVAILKTKAEAINLLTIAGYEPASVVDAVEAEDLGRLAQAHTGLFSVQLQPPGSQQANGNGSTPALLAPSSN